MPIHRTAMQGAIALQDLCKSLERQGEKVRFIEIVEGQYLIFTDKKPQARPKAETR